MKVTNLTVIYLFAFALAFVTCVPQEVQAKTSSTTKTSANSTKKTVNKSTKSTKSSKYSKYTNKKSAKRKASSVPADNYAALVVDANTGRVLYEKNAGATRYPASLTKMMTLYLTFDALKRGKLSLDQGMAVSAKAASQPATNISLKTGDRLPVRKAIESLVVRSANDAAVVLAEAIGQTEWNFGLLMTQKARELGMKSTIFRNPHGLPDSKQHTTAYDMARLAIALRRDFPEYYKYFSTTEMSYNGVNYTTHNRVLTRYQGADGIKTGYIRASGFNLVTSAKRSGFNLVGVVMGGTSSSARDQDMINLLDRTFAQLESQKNSMAGNNGGQDDSSQLSMDGTEEVAFYKENH
ncbi:MAG: D-alanyl-D-alanine carboxypeptidase family protein [Alphaproteobacteria bacterium]